MNRSEQVLFHLDSVTAGYGQRPVLRHLHLHIPRGLSLGVLGPNGAGKSTLLRILSGVLRPLQGQVLWEGRPLHHLSRRERARRMAVVRQAAVPLFGFTGWEWVQMGRSPHVGRLQPLSEHDREVILQAMERTETLHLRDRLVQEVSGGELQRLFLARALAQEPDVLLLDEPTAHLDLHHQVELLNLLASLRSTTGLTLIWVSHDWNLAADYCNRLMVLHQGTLFAEGRPQEVLTEEVLHAIYGQQVQVAQHPVDGRPLVLPVAREKELSPICQAKTGEEPPCVGEGAQPVPSPAPWRFPQPGVGGRRARWAVLGGWGIAALAVLLVAVAVGPVNIPVGELFRALLGGTTAGSQVHTIVWQLRLPRSLLAMSVGAALAVAGALMQALFQNPMAEPYVVGVSSGAALGAILALLLRLPWEWAGLSAATLLAFAGGMGAAFLVFLLSRRAGRISVATLLLTGLAISALAASLSSLLLFLFQQDLQRVFFWTMGSFAGRRWVHLGVALPYLLLGILIALLSVRDLNLLLLGEEDATHLGLDVSRARKLFLFLSALLAAAAVAVSGIIGFVGLIVPHLLRLMVGPDHRWLLPGSMLAGGVLLVVADTIARSVMVGEVPIGILTSLLGAPFFLFLLLRSGREV